MTDLLLIALNHLHDLGGIIVTAMGTSPDPALLRSEIAQRLYAAQVALVDWDAKMNALQAELDAAVPPKVQP